MGDRFANSDRAPTKVDRAVLCGFSTALLCRLIRATARVARISHTLAAIPLVLDMFHSHMLSSNKPSMSSL